MEQSLFISVLLMAPLHATAHRPGEVLVLVGTHAFLAAAITPGFHVREAIWKSLTPAEELLATSFKGSAESLYRSRFYGRSMLHGNLTLEIGPVGLGDSGTFSVLLVNTTGEMEEHIFHLTVYDAVSTPIIRVFGEESDPNTQTGSCTLFLTCIAPVGTNITYTWARSAGKNLTRDQHAVFENGQVLWANLDLPKDAQVTYTCTAFNVASRQSATVNIQEQCHRQSGAKETPYDYRGILLIIVSVVSLSLSTVAIFVIRSKQHTGNRASYTVSDGEPVPV